MKPDNVHKSLSEGRALSWTLSSASVLNSEPDRELERHGHELLEDGSDPVPYRLEIRLLMALRRAISNMNAKIVSTDGEKDHTPTPPPIARSHAPSPIIKNPDANLTPRPLAPSPLPVVDSLPSLPKGQTSALTTQNWFDEVDENSKGLRDAIYAIKSQTYLLLHLENLEDTPVSALVSLDQVIGDFERKLDKFSNLRTVNASFSSFPRCA